MSRGAEAYEVKKYSQAAFTLHGCFLFNLPLSCLVLQIAVFAQADTEAPIVDKEWQSPTAGKVIDSSNAPWVTVQQ